MPNNQPRQSDSRVAGTFLLVVRGVLSVVLAAGAVVLLLHGRKMFERLGRPDEARVVLAWAEIVGAGLFVFPRTTLAGGVVLVSVLAWAAGFHFGLGQAAMNLWLYLALVLALLAVELARRLRAIGRGTDS